VTEPVDIYGANFPLFEKLRLLAEWAPLLARLQEVAAAKTPHEQALAAVSVAQWAAGKSETLVDDEMLAHVEAVLKTPAGQEFLEWTLEKIMGSDE
jgi:hypothetical protein